MADEALLLIPSVELTTDGVIAFAMRSEHDAQKFYDDLALIIDDAAGNALLRQLGEQERQHFALLSRTFKEHFPEAWERSVHRMRAGSISGSVPPPSPISQVTKSPRELLTIAKWEELRARALYEAGALAAGHDFPQVASLLSRLARDENRHFTRLEELGKSLDYTSTDLD